MRFCFKQYQTKHFLNTGSSVVKKLWVILFLAIFSGLLHTGIPPRADVLHAQNYQESREQSSREFVVKKNEFFRDYRFALSFRLPLRARGLYAPRGNFFSVELEPADEQAFFIYHTSFRIRRESGVRALVERVYGPCKVPDVPTEDEFRIATSCPGKVGLNKLNRHVLLMRKKELLHLLVVTARSEKNTLAQEILESIVLNKDFCFENKICPYR